MRAETVHVTDHALLRWRQRASKTGDVKVQEIVEAVKGSRVIKRNEPLPYCMPRVDGSVYSINSGVLFILESVTIDEYRLITVIAEELVPPRTSTKPKPLPKVAKPKVKATKKKTKPLQPLPPKRGWRPLSLNSQMLEDKLNAILDESEAEYARSSGDWTKAGPVHVQPTIAGLPDLAPEGDSVIQLATRPNSAA